MSISWKKATGFYFQTSQRTAGFSVLAVLQMQRSSPYFKFDMIIQHNIFKTFTFTVKYYITLHSHIEKTDEFNYPKFVIE